MKLRVELEKQETGDILESSLKEMKWGDHHKLVELTENADIPAEVEDNPYHLMGLQRRFEVTGYV